MTSSRPSPCRRVCSSVVRAPLARLKTILPTPWLPRAPSPLFVCPSAQTKW